MSADSYKSLFSKLLKQTIPGSPNPTVTLTAFRDSRSCVVTTLKEYISRTESLRGSESQLFVSYSKPHKAVSRDKISRWVKTVLALKVDDVTLTDALEIAESMNSYFSTVLRQKIMEISLSIVMLWILSYQLSFAIQMRSLTF